MNQGMIKRFGLVTQKLLERTLGTAMSAETAARQSADQALQQTLSTMAGPGCIVDVFTQNGTWVKRPGITAITVFIINGGGGGGSGRRGDSGTNRYGGGGGAAGQSTFFHSPAATLPATLQVTVGAGGQGGAAVTIDNTNGNAGTSGGISRFGGMTPGHTGVGAGPGSGGTATSSSGGNPFLGLSQPGSGGPGTTADGGWAGSMCANTATGGAGGAGLNKSNVPGGGGRNYSPCIYGDMNIPPLAARGGNGLQGTIPPGGLYGWGGGGGAAHDTADSGNGADATGYGGGGGGGAASANGYKSGKGGNGSSGIVVVFNYF